MNSIVRQQKPMANLVDELTITQRALLAFLADLVPAPPVRSNSGTYRVLRSRGLIEFDDTDRWRVTSLGQKTAQELLP